MSMMCTNPGQMRKNNIRYLSLGAIFLACMILVPLFRSPVLAADNEPRKSGQGNYGEKQKIATEGEARKALEKYFAGKDVVIGELVEKELYFEADIMDGKRKVIDKVIVDKRTGRVRSIY